MTTDAFASVPWEVVTSGDVTTLHKHRVPYTSPANSLQNLDIWIPSPSTASPSSSELPAKDGLWVIYIHGGAWRDPLVDSSSFNATVKHLTTSHFSHLPKIAGLASINYSLSPNPNHPTHPCPPKDGPGDPSRLQTHPRHIFDVLTGLKYLQEKAGFGSNYVLLGHSCGATLAFQVAMAAIRWGAEAEKIGVAKPRAIVGLNGLYDMPTLIREPGEKHAALKSVYRDFTIRGFGEDESVWQSISPVSVDEWSKEWKEGEKVVLVQSKDDSLVPYWQLEDMRKKLLESKAEGLELTELDADGDHNELWQKGDRLAEIVVEVVNSLT